MSKVRVTNIALDENGEPSEITMALPARVAAVLTKMLGSTLHGKPEMSEVYYELTSRVFDRFYEDGVDDALKH